MRAKAIYNLAENELAKNEKYFGDRRRPIKAVPISLSVHYYARHRRNVAKNKSKQFLLNFTATSGDDTMRKKNQ